MSKEAFKNSLDLRCDSVLLPTIERFGVEGDNGAVASFGTVDVAFSTELHPRHSQDGPEDTGIDLFKKFIKHTQYI